MSVSAAQLAAECMFLEAAYEVIDPGAARLSEKHLQALEKLAFDWVIRKEAYVGVQYAGQPEVINARNQVCAQGCWIVQSAFAHGLLCKPLICRGICMAHGCACLAEI